MITVKAIRDIVTPNGFRVAYKGATGKPVKDALPIRPEHWRKVLVTWHGRGKGYWCNPADLCINNGDITKFIATRPPVVPAELLPVASGACEFHFGSNLRRLRFARHISQTALAIAMSKRGCNVAQSAICHREKKPDAPGSLFVSAAARALSVPPFVFFINWDSCDAFSEARKFLCCMSSTLCDIGDH